MPSLYPGGIDVFIEVQPGDEIVAQHPNERGDGLTAVQTTLGTNPQGSYGTVRERLDALVGAGKYDSGWFAVANGGTYTLSHNLGTTKLIGFIWWSPNSNGTNAESWAHQNQTSTGPQGLQLRAMGSANVTLYAGSNGTLYSLSDGIRSGGYARVLLLAVP